MPADTTGFPGQRITDPAVLAAKLAEIAASPRGPAVHFEEFWFDAPMPAGLDPLSPAYRSAVLAQFGLIAGREYAPALGSRSLDEGSIGSLLRRPWPYDTGEATQVGGLLTAIGFVLSTCKPRAGHRVLEMGASWGNLTLPLAQMGCAVTALDAEEHHIRVIRHRSECADMQVRTVRSGFLEAAAALGGELFDLVVFHDALHRCDDHLALLHLVRDQLLAPGGRLVLAGEPLLETLPYPWGLNPQGHGLWAIRMHGTLELVFRPSYLLGALDAIGFNAALTVCPLTALGNTIVASRRSNVR